jgi:hypothetical protein
MKHLIRLICSHWIAVVLSCLWLVPGAQGVPPLINYQGQLLDASGNPMATGDYNVEIKLYSAESGGAVVWGPQTFNGQSGTGLGPKVSVVQGHFNLILGPKDTADRNLVDIVGTNPSLFLELKVGSGNPIAPRQQLLTAPYALSAATTVNATKLNGYDWSPIFSGGDPVNGNFAVGVAHNTTDAKADFNGRIRVRQGIFGSAGIWFAQNGAFDRAFVGMLDNDNVGFYTAAGAGWAFRVNVNDGYTWALGLQLGPVRMSGSDGGPLFGPGLYFSGVQSVFLTEAAIYARAFTVSSDERLKENIETIEDPLGKLRAIRGVRYNFAKNESRKILNPEGRQLGVLAQDVQKVLPEAVSPAPDGYLSVNYNALIPVLLQAVKEQQTQIEILQAEVAALRRLTK